MTKDLDSIYLEPKDSAEVDSIDKAVEAPKMIDLIMNGAKDYKGFKDGEKLSKIHVCSILQAGRDNVQMGELYDEIAAEKEALKAIHPCEYTTLTKFREALEAVSVYIPVATWIDKLKVVYGCETWTAILAWCQANYGQEV